MITCTAMVAVEGDPENPHMCDRPALPYGDEPRCSGHLVRVVIAVDVEAYQSGVAAAQRIIASREPHETTEYLVAEANLMLDALESTGHLASRTRGYRDTLLSIQASEAQK